jgi:hypothetical protein
MGDTLSVCVTDSAEPVPIQKQEVEKVEIYLTNFPFSSHSFFLLLVSCRGSKWCNSS